MMRELGRDCLCPFSPAANSKDAIDAAWPQHKVLMGFRMYCMVSYIASPAVTAPPGELMYMLICTGNICLSAPDVQPHTGFVS